MQEAAQATEAAFTEPEFRGPNGGKTGVAEFARPGFGDVEANLAHQVAERLRVPGIKMMVGFLWIESVVFPAAFQRDEKEQFAAGGEEAAHFRQSRRRVGHVLERVMAQNHVGCCVGDLLCVGDVFDAQGADGRLEEIGDIEADFAAALQRRQVPAQADPVFQDDIAGPDGRGQFFGAQPRDPREGGVGDAALELLVTASGVALIMALCWLQEHGASLSPRVTLDNHRSPAKLLHARIGRS